MPPFPLAYPRAISLVAAAGLVACLPGGEVDLGRNLEAGAASAIEDAALGGDAAQLGQPVPVPLFSASISAAMGTICAGSCVELLATASGAPGPYSYSWGPPLGEGRGPKSVCPVATTTYSVQVDSQSSEQQATASAMVTVITCDAGSMPPAAPDAGPAPGGDAGSPPTTQALCVSNPSFEATTLGTGGPPPPTGVPPQWQICQGAPNVDPSISLLPAANGSTYEGLPVGTGTFSGLTSSVGTTLCAPLVAGVSYSFCMDLALGVRGVMPPLTGGTPSPALELWGGSTPCNQGALLWPSPPITNVDSWSSVCGTFVAPRSLTTITLVPAEGSAGTGTGAWSYVIVDDITAGP